MKKKSTKSKHLSGAPTSAAKQFMPMIAGLFIAVGANVHALEVQWHETISSLPNMGTKSCAVTTLYDRGEVQLTNVFASESEFLVSSLSRLNIWASSLLSIEGDFSQPSNYVPGPGRYLVVWQNGKTRLRLDRLTPEHRDRTLARLVHDTRIVPPGPGVQVNTEMISVQPHPTQLLESVRTSHGVTARSFNTSAAQHLRSCQDIKARWCGDGVVDAEQGEQCDSGMKNGNADSTCNAHCQRS